MADPAPADRSLAGRAVGVVAGAAGLAASLFVLFGPVVTVTSAGSDGSTTTSTVSGIDYLLGAAGAQFELFAWPVLLGVVSAVGAAAAWYGWNRWAWAAALSLAAFAVVGMFSIGLLYAPAAGLLLGAAALGRGG